METTMQSQLDIQGMKISRQARELIKTQLEKLEDRFGKITACRLAIRPPGQRLGTPHAVILHLTLPGGREVNVGRLARAPDGRYADLLFALHDTFRKAVRQLQRQVSRMRRPARPVRSRRKEARA
jgi:hypothetical protein